MNWSDSQWWPITNYFYQPSRCHLEHHRIQYKRQQQWAQAVPGLRNQAHQQRHRLLNDKNEQIVPARRVQHEAHRTSFEFGGLYEWLTNGLVHTFVDRGRWKGSRGSTTVPLYAAHFYFWFSVQWYSPVCKYNAHRSEKVTSKAPNLYFQLCVYYHLLINSAWVNPPPSVNSARPSFAWNCSWNYEKFSRLIFYAHSGVIFRRL